MRGWLKVPDNFLNFIARPGDRLRSTIRHDRASNPAGTIGQVLCSYPIAAMTGPLDFESLVSLHYVSLYRFALSLTRKESDACDLTQQTFYVWASKGHQLEDVSKVKSC